MTYAYAQFVRALASRRMRTTAVALLVAGSLVTHAAPPERLLTAIIGSTLGFSLLFAWLFFHSGIHQLSRRQRGPFTLVVLVVLSLLLVVQAHAVLTIALEATGVTGPSPMTRGPGPASKQKARLSAF